MQVTLTMFGPTAHGESPEQTAANLRRAGATNLLFFTSLYHGYRLLQPRYPHKSIYSLECDKVFYEPDLSFYEDSSVKPDRSDEFAQVDSMAALCRAMHHEGLEFTPLVPICAGARLVQDRPDLAVRNIYGCADRLFMCYNNPDLRAYRLAMLAEISSRYEIDGLILDKIPQTQLEQYAFSGILAPPLRTVGSFCFCEHCHQQARRFGLDLDQVKSRCLEIANRTLKIPPHVIAAQGDKLIGDTEMPLLLLEEPLIYQMLQFRFDSAVEFVGELAATVKQHRPGVSVQAAFVPASHLGHDATSPRAWLAVQSYRKYADVFDEICTVVHYDPDVVRFETERAVAAAEGRTRIVTGMRLYGATSPEMVAQLGQAALAGGSTGVHFLGYDITTDELLQALGQWVKSTGDH